MERMKEAKEVDHLICRYCKSRGCPKQSHVSQRGGDSLDGGIRSKRGGQSNERRLMKEEQPYQLMLTPSLSISLFLGIFPVLILI